MNTTNTTRTAQVVKENRTATGHYMDVESGRTSVSVAVTKYGVRVLVNNASARVWRASFGRQFNTWAEAAAGYRHAGVLACIAEAQAHVAVAELLNA